jgi:hypothetical protein
MKKASLAVLAAVLILILSVSAHASFGVDFVNPSPNQTFTSGNSYSLGWEFTVGNQPLFLKSLGYFAYGTDGILVDTHPVGIFDTTGNLLVSTTVTTADPLAGWWRWSSVESSNIQLAAGQTYIVSAPTIRDSYTLNPIGFTVNPLITYDAARWEFSTLLVFPTNVEPSVTAGYFGPNIDFRAAPVPVPPSLFLLAPGLLGVIGLRRRAFFR